MLFGGSADLVGRLGVGCAGGFIETSGGCRGRDGDRWPPPAQIPASGATVPPLALSHATIAVGSYNTVSTSVSAYLNVAKDGGNLAEVVREAPNTAGYQDAGLAQREMLSAISTTWKWQTKETAGTTVNPDELAIAVLQLDATPPTRRHYMALAG